MAASSWYWRHLAAVTDGGGEADIRDSISAQLFVRHSFLAREVMHDSDPEQIFGMLSPEQASQWPPFTKTLELTVVQGARA